ncbi:hypothetical protein [Hydrogenophaga intermedia]|uniref:hypothetical protein n=1 Tax=Hydrogenophaga intermedia TaxID=65786 RepID=UPI002043CD8D|nr:hypothetical protein [Hydrogenophaga intermedia]MCM3565508.1 hypothetical protein [Hydrogenophaga intermedia]
MKIPDITNHAGPDRTKAALDEFLARFLSPAFGALPKLEVELLVLRLLTQVGAVDERPSVYELVSKLRITRAKARRLIYDQDLRSRTQADLDGDVRRLLRKPIIQKRGDLFVLEVENPLLSDHLRALLQRLGHVSDGSFSPSLVTLTLDAMVALIEEQLSETERSATLEALVKAGAPDKSLKGVLKSALKKLGEKIADDAGEAVADEVASYLGPLMDSSKSEIISAFRSVFSKPASKSTRD